MPALQAGYPFSEAAEERRMAPVRKAETLPVRRWGQSAERSSCAFPALLVRGRGRDGILRRECGRLQRRVGGKSADGKGDDKEKRGQELIPALSGFLFLPHRKHDDGKGEEGEDEDGGQGDVHLVPEAVFGLDMLFLLGRQRGREIPVERFAFRLHRLRIVAFGDDGRRNSYWI